ncbi:MAG TPA: hypothetical protein VFF27_12795 [Bacteroidia bacterium]|jgi:hypothetical protein|nr:hypothetical protein [Bacteroidia bacterium]
MKKKLLSIVFTLFAGLILAQTPEKSVSFPEPDGWTKLIQLRNNNTGLLEVTKKEGLNFTLYNPQHKVITSGKLNLVKTSENFRYAQVEGVYDISGDFCVFVVGTDPDNKKVAVFFRIIIDGNTGKLKSEEVIDKLPEMTMGAAYGMLFGDTDVPTFYVEKDPLSDYYAVVKYSTLEAETKDRIEIFHYGPDHKIINKAKYNTPTDKYKFTKYLACYVHGADYVLVGTSAFNTKKSGGEDIRYYVAQLSKGKTTFVQKELKYDGYDKSSRAYFIYNKPKDMVNMLLIINNTQINQNINPTSLALDKPYNTDFTTVNNFYKTKMGNKKDFAPMIEGSFIDKNGNISFLYQQVTKYTKSTGIGMPAVVEKCLFGDAAIITMSPEGKEVSSTAFPLNIIRIGDHDPMCYNSARKGRKVNGGFTPVADDDWYRSIDFISTENGCYLFFNNRLDNMEKPEDKDAGVIGGISGTTGVKYTYKNGKITKDYLFGKPANKKEASFINPGASDYNETTKTYTTLVVSPKEKTAHVVWMKLE